MEFAPCNAFVALGGHDASQFRMGRIEGMGHTEENTRDWEGRHPSHPLA